MCVQMLSFSSDTGLPSFCHSFIAANYICCWNSAEKSAVQACEISTVAIFTYDGTFLQRAERRCRDARHLVIDALDVSSNNTKLVHWPLMGGLLYLVQRGGGDWAGCSPAQSPPRCTKCNSPPINGQCTNHCIAI